MPKGANCIELLTVVLTSMGIILISVLRDFLIMNLLSTFSAEQEAGIAFSFTVQREGNEARGANSSGGPREDELPGRSPKQVPATIQGEELTPKTLSTRNFKKRTRKSLARKAAGLLNKLQYILQFNGIDNIDI